MTLFEKIIAREIPSQIIGEGDDWLAFHDINPQAPVHFLVVPKRVIPRLSESVCLDENLLGTLLAAAVLMASQEGLAEKGHRVVINCGEYGGETVPHLHLHVLGGRQMKWPPG